MCLLFASASDRLAVGGRDARRIGGKKLDAAKADGVRKLEEILSEDAVLGANKKCVKASRELYSVLARYTSFEASTIVRSVTGLDRVEAGPRRHANCSERTLGIRYRVQRECVYPKPAKDVSQVRLAILQREEKWEAMMSELGRGAKIPDLWRMSALLEFCPTDVKEQMMMRVDEIGES